MHLVRFLNSSGTYSHTTMSCLCNATDKVTLPKIILGGQTDMNGTVLNGTAV